MKGLLVASVVPDSIAEELGIGPGDRLLAINGQPLRDLIDYHYFGDEENLLLEFRSANGEIWEAEIESDAGEPLGLVFAPPSPARCGNRCVFCFVHQLPKGLRKPLYVKDEDYRLSFLCGNYVTLANVTAADLTRIKEQRLSPLYVSVHVTDPLVREQLLGKQGLTPILPVLQELAAARIKVHTQIVVCPGWNDGEVLQRTVADLVALYPAVQSIAVVPVGLTSHRQRLPKLEPVSDAYAAQFLDVWQACAERLTRQLGEPILFLADEWFIKAERQFPPLATYGDLPQLENGVGMIPLFLEEAAEVLATAHPLPSAPVTVVTGESPARYLADFCRELSRRTTIDLTAVPVPNRLFGPLVTVTGLVSGKDVIAALQGRNLGLAVIIPDVMLKEGEGVFLDDLTPADIAAACGVPVVVAEATPAGLYAALCTLPHVG